MTAFLLLLSGCGYHLSNTSGLSPAVVGKKIAIPVFANKSYRANVGAILTESLVDETARRSGGMVTSEEAADLVLNGTVLTYTTLPVSYTALDTVKEYRAVINVEATLTEKNTQKVIWKGTLSWSQDYPANTTFTLSQSGIDPIALQQNSEEAAIREICNKIALQLYQKISQGF
jgi:outer membrane lipopolysaccharide assembly protein LptE/RlpB